MATDIADKSLKQNRQLRWDAAFNEQATDSQRMDTDRRATITYEYIIQASDISHTMQVRKADNFVNHSSIKSISC
jgi:hypothetical protein